MGVTGILPSIVLLTLAQKIVNPPSEQSEDGECGDVEQEVQHVRLPHFLTRFTGFGPATSSSIGMPAASANFRNPVMLSALPNSFADYSNVRRFVRGGILL
jgi:hypothetical protein